MEDIEKFKAVVEQFGIQDAVEPDEQLKKSSERPILEIDKMLTAPPVVPAVITPQRIEVLREKATYRVPLYEITNDGLREWGQFDIQFAKGNKADPETYRQVGFFTETLLAVCVKYLQENNVGDLASKETSVAITNIEQAILWLGKRAADRQARGVQGTYQK